MVEDTQTAKQKSDKSYRQRNPEKVRMWANKYRLANPEKVAASRKRDSQNNKKRIKNTNLQKFGITLEKYNEILTNQSGCCKICKTHESKLTKALAVDHNHATGEIRGLLCHNCNIGLGHFKDSENLLLTAAQYILDNGTSTSNKLEQ